MTETATESQAVDTEATRRALILIHDELRIARKRRDDVKDRLATLQAAATAQFNADHAELLEDLRQKTSEAVTLDVRARGLILKFHKETGEKKPLPGFGVKNVSEYEIVDKVKAFGWAIEHKMALLLDEKALIKIAKAQPAQMTEIVTYEEVPRPEISPNLEPLPEQMVVTAAEQEVFVQVGPSEIGGEA